MNRFQIMLIEDNRGDITLIKEALKSEGLSHELSVATDGEDALVQLNQCRNIGCLPDLVILDINIPKIDGFDLLSEIKTDKKLKIIPVIILTTSSADRDVKKAYEYHANSFVVKPLELEGFMHKVKSIHHFWNDVAVVANKK